MEKVMNYEIDARESKIVERNGLDRVMELVGRVGVQPIWPQGQREPAFGWLVD